MAVNFLTQKIPAFRAIILGTLISASGMDLLIIASRRVWMAVVTLLVVALGEIIQSPRYYEYISRLAPPDSRAPTWDLRFCRIGIGSLIGGMFGGMPDAPLWRSAASTRQMVVVVR